MIIRKSWQEVIGASKSLLTKPYKTLSLWTLFKRPALRMISVRILSSNSWSRSWPRRKCLLIYCLTSNSWLVEFSNSSLNKIKTSPRDSRGRAEIMRPMKDSTSTYTGWSSNASSTCSKATCAGVWPKLRSSAFTSLKKTRLRYSVRLRWSTLGWLFRTGETTLRKSCLIR